MVQTLRSLRGLAPPRPHHLHRTSHAQISSTIFYVDPALDTPVEGYLQPPPPPPPLAWSAAAPPSPPSAPLDDSHQLTTTWLTAHSYRWVSEDTAGILLVLANCAMFALLVYFVVQMLSDSASQVLV